MARRGFLLPILLIALHLSACATVPILPSETPSGAEILLRIEDRQRSIQGLKALAEVKVSSRQRELNGQQVLLVRRPTSLRLESLSPVGTPLLYAVTDGGNLNLYLPGDHRYYQGSFQAGAHFLALPPDLPAEDMISFLLGGVTEKKFAKVTVASDRRKGLWVVEQSSPSGDEIQTLWVEPGSFSLHQVEVQSPHLSYRAEFSQFQDEKGFPFPRRLMLTSPQIQARIALDYRELELNPQWTDQDFHLPVPRGATVLPIP